MTNTDDIRVILINAFCELKGFTDIHLIATQISFDMLINEMR